MKCKYCGKEETTSNNAFSEDFTIKALKAIKKIIGEDNFNKVLADFGVKESEIKDKETFDKISVACWKIKQEQKKVKNA